MRRQAERRGTGRPPAQTVGINRHMFRVEVNASFALVAPELVEKHARRGQRLRLARQHLRLRPVHAVDLRLARRELTEVLVFGAVFEALVEAISFDVMRDVFIPLLYLCAWKDIADHARAARLDERDLLAAHAPFGDVGELNFRNDVFAAIAPRGDPLRFLADRLLDLREHFAVVRQRGAQFLLADRARQVIDFQRHDRLHMNFRGHSI